MELKIIARIKTGYGQKFGIPRQSGLVEKAKGQLVFEPEFRNPDAIRGLEEFTHLWLIWGFSENEDKGYSLTVAPPRLGGKEKRGVFATRSPFRPNGFGLSAVAIESIDWDCANGPVINVLGADLMDETPIYDIKPYLPYSDSIPKACGGFGSAHQAERIKVVWEDAAKRLLDDELIEVITDILAQDPRAAYNKAPDYIYGMNYAGYDIRFVAEDAQLRVVEVVPPDREFIKVK